MVAPAGGKSTTFTPGILSQVAAGMRLALTGKTPDWFGPGEPLVPVAPPETAGRRMDFPVHANITVTPKAESNSQGVTFDQLRNLADSLDILRLVIETRKDQVSKMEWTIKAKEGKTVSEAKIQELKDLFAFPDGHNDFHAWTRRLLEDLFVLDAPAIYVQRTKGGKILAFEPIDGATIKRLLDEGGRTPQAPTPAYQQILKGLPATNLTVDDLVYAPRNMRNHMIYGYGPVEQIIVTVNIGIRRMLGQLAYFTDGSVPDAIAETPANWTAEQVEQFQDYWDSILSGNEQQKRHLRFVPSGAKFQTLKPELLADKFDEWLARIVCYAFSVSHQPFASQVNRATAATAHDAALQEGLAPILHWIKALCDRLLRQYLGHSDVEFSWNEDEAQDPLVEAQIDQILVNTGILTVDEAREKRGYDPLPAATVETPVPALGAPFSPADAAPPHEGAPTLAPTAAAPSGAEQAPPPAAKPGAAAQKLAKAKRPTSPKPSPKHEKTVRAAIKKWARGLPGKVAAQVTAQVGKVDKAKGDRATKITSGVNLNTDPLAKALMPVYEAVFVEAATDSGVDLTDAMLEVVNEDAVKWAETQVGNLITGIDSTTKDLIRTDVVQALNEGLSTADLADLLADNYAFSDARAETIARTETAHAAVSGTMAGWQESGVVDHVEFDASPDCCDECAAEDGKELDWGTDPEDFMHPNCRCGVTAVLSDTTEE